MAEKVIQDGVDPSVYITILFGGHTNKFFKIRRNGRAAGYGKRNTVRLIRQLQRTFELALEQAYHADAVFKLRVLLVEIVLGKLAARADIHLVRAEKYPRSVFLHALVAEGRDHVYGLRRMLGSKRLERIQALAVFRKTDRNYRHTVHRRVHRRKIFHCAHESPVVVKARAAYDLAVHDDTAVCKAAHYIDAFPRVFIAQELDAQLRVGSVDGDIHGAYVQVCYALYLALGEVRERDVVSQKEAQSRIIVLKIHRLAHSLRELIDKAEHAVICAASRIIHKILGKLKAEIAPLGLLHAHRVLHTVGSAQRYVQHRVVGKVFIVEHIVDHISVYADYLIAYMRLVQQRAVVIYF